MAEPQRFKGVAHNGRIELEPGAKIPDGAEVIVLFGDQQAAEQVKLEARERLFALMKIGADLGGGPYFKRDAMYGDSGRAK